MQPAQVLSWTSNQPSRLEQMSSSSSSSSWWHCAGACSATNTTTASARSGPAGGQAPSAPAGCPSAACAGSGTTSASRCDLILHHTLVSRLLVSSAPEAAEASRHTTWKHSPMYLQSQMVKRNASPLQLDVGSCSSAGLLPPWLPWLGLACASWPSIGACSLAAGQ